MNRISVLSVFGTRPEAIKMVPLLKALQKDIRFESLIVVTAQHREMLDQVMNTFKVKPDYDLNLMKDNQSLSELTSRILENLTPILKCHKPDIVLVHGDTTTALASALAAFYQRIKVGHVEAGLRTWDKYSPFPEEINRQLIDKLSDIHFAPTKKAKENLEKENHLANKIYITGNTAIDVMKYTIQKNYIFPKFLNLKINTKMIMVTIHRRENIGKPLENICKSIYRVANETNDIEFIFPMHRNPKIRRKVLGLLGGIPNIHLVEPLEVMDFHNILARSYMILTDSGGIQEEAPSLGIPVLVLRDTTERPEGVSANTLKLIGTDENRVYNEIKKLLVNEEEYKKMSMASNPYGNGKASEKILNLIANEFSYKKR